MSTRKCLEGRRAGLMGPDVEYAVSHQQTADWKGSLSVRARSPIGKEIFGASERFVCNRRRTDGTRTNTT